MMIVYHNDNNIFIIKPFTHTCTHMHTYSAALTIISEVSLHMERAIADLV